MPDAIAHTGYPAPIIRAAVKAGTLRAERPSGWERGPYYFTESDLDAWLDSITVNAEES